MCANLCKAGRQAASCLACGYCDGCTTKEMAVALCSVTAAALFIDIGWHTISTLYGCSVVDVLAVALLISKG